MDENKKCLYLFIPIGLIVFHIFLIVVYDIFQINNCLIEFLYEKILVFLFFMSIINAVLTLFIKAKKRYLFHIGFEILEFCILHIFISLIISAYIWYKRDVALIHVTNIECFNFETVFGHIVIRSLIISYIIILFLNIMRSFKIDKNICGLLFPLKYIVLYTFFFFTGGFETLCVWNPLIDTKHSETFNVYNIVKVEEGVKKGYINSMVGEPLGIYTDKDGIIHFKYTQDGKYNYGDYAWFDFQLEFKDDIVIKKIRRWNYD